MERARGRGRGASRRRGGASSAASASVSHTHNRDGADASTANATAETVANAATGNNGSSISSQSDPALNVTALSPSPISGAARTPTTISQRGRAKTFSPISLELSHSSRNQRSDKSSKGSSNLTNSFTSSTPIPTTPATPARGGTSMRTRRSTYDVTPNGADGDASVSKGGHSLRKRTRIDYSLVEVQSADVSTAKAEAKPAIPASTRGRKRKVIYHDGAAGGAHHDDSDSVTPSIAKKPRLSSKPRDTPPPASSRRGKPAGKSIPQPQSALTPNRHQPSSDSDIKDTIEVNPNSLESSDYEEEDSSNEPEEMPRISNGQRVPVEDEDVRSGENFENQPSSDGRKPQEGGGSSLPVTSGAVETNVESYDDHVTDSPGQAHQLDEEHANKVNHQDVSRLPDKAPHGRSSAHQPTHNARQRDSRGVSHKGTPKGRRQRLMVNLARGVAALAKIKSLWGSRSPTPNDESDGHEQTEIAPQSPANGSGPPQRDSDQEHNTSLAENQTSGKSETTSVKGHAGALVHSPAEDSVADQLEEPLELPTEPSLELLSDAPDSQAQLGVANPADHPAEQQSNQPTTEEGQPQLSQPAVDGASRQQSHGASSVGQLDDSQWDDKETPFGPARDEIAEVTEEQNQPPVKSAPDEVPDEESRQKEIYIKGVPSTARPIQEDIKSDGQPQESSEAGDGPLAGNTAATDVQAETANSSQLLPPSGTRTPTPVTPHSLDHPPPLSPPSASSPHTSSTDLRHQTAASDVEVELEGTASRLTPITPVDSAQTEVEAGPESGMEEGKASPAPPGAGLGALDTLNSEDQGRPEEPMSILEEMDRGHDSGNDGANEREKSRAGGPALADLEAKVEPEIKNGFDHGMAKDIEQEARQVVVPDAIAEIKPIAEPVVVEPDVVEAAVEVESESEPELEPELEAESEVESELGSEAEIVEDRLSPQPARLWSHLTPYVSGVVSYPEDYDSDQEAPMGSQEDRDDVRSDGVLPRSTDDKLPDGTKDAPPSSQEIVNTDDPGGVPSARTDSPAPARYPRMHRERRHFKKLRDASEFADVISDYKSMSTEDLVDCLATINKSLCAWQDEYVSLRRTIDADYNAPRRRADEVKEDDRIARALDRYKNHGVYELDTGDNNLKKEPKGFQLKRTLEPRRWTMEIDRDGDQVRADSRANDKVMAQAYGFDYDSREVAVGKQEPLDQRDGASNKPRTRARPKQTQKAAEAEAEDGVILSGKRIRKRRILDDESRVPSRASTPVPVAAKPTRRGRRAIGTEHEPTTSGAATPTPAAEPEAAQVEDEAEAAVSAGGRKLTRRPRGILKAVQHPLAAPAPALDTAVTTNGGQPIKDADAADALDAADAATALPATRKRRRGPLAKDDGPVSSEPLVAADLAATSAAADENDGEPATKRQRKRTGRADLFRPANRPSGSEIASGRFYNTTSPPVQEVPDQEEQSRPASSSSNATIVSNGSSYSNGRRKRSRKTRDLDGGAGEHVDVEAPPPAKRSRNRRSEAVAVQVGPVLPAPAVLFAPSQLAVSQPIAPQPVGMAAPSHHHQYPPQQNKMHPLLQRPPSFIPSVQYPQSPVEHGSFGVLQLGPGMQHHTAPPARQRQQQQQHSMLAMPVGPGLAHPHHQPQQGAVLPSSSTSRSTAATKPPRELKIKNMTPGLVGGNQNQNNNNNNQRQQRGAGGSGRRISTTPVPLPPASASASGGSGAVSRAASPSVGGGANGEEPEKDYASMTKSEKMSHSMKSRWKNGSMQGAVAKRKETLRLKKVKAQEESADPKPIIPPLLAPAIPGAPRVGAAGSA